MEKVIDLKNYENEGIFLEGTGSIVFDHPYKKAYACLSSRTSIVLLKKVCETLGYDSVTFEAFDESGQAIYHTNVMMWIGTTVGAICAESLQDLKTRVKNNTHFFSKFILNFSSFFSLKTQDMVTRILRGLTI